jgi:succinate dehydrogenase/fumarate reductase cytochrome b subunit
LKLDRSVWPWTLRIVVVVFYVGLAIYAVYSIRTLFTDWQYSTPWPRLGQGHVPAFLEDTPDAAHATIPLG